MSRVIGYHGYTYLHSAGMDCAHCAETIEKGVSKLAGVQSASVDFVTGRLRLTGDPALTALQERVAVLGYQLELPTQTPRSQPNLNDAAC